jgi:glucose-6-phosphate dehydrogenase assembly protein OpcA
MEKKITITYSWWNAERTPIPNNVQEALEETAMDRIANQMNEGYTSGELNDNVKMNDNDPKDGVEYQGFWGMTTETL